MWWLHSGCFPDRLTDTRAALAAMRNPRVGPLDRAKGGSYGLRIIGLILTLILLFGITYVVLSATAPAFPGAEVAVLIGFILLVANVTGSLVASVGLPRLTGYLIVGILAGPSVFGMVSVGAVEDLALIDSFALALIAVLAGGELKLSQLRPQARNILYVTLAVTGVVWAGMALIVLVISPLVPFLSALPFTGVLAVALILGIWAANSSPDLTVAVIEETHTSGPLADVVLGVTIVKDVVVIVLFTLTMALVAPLLNPGEQLTSHVLVELGQEVGGALVLGAALGWVFSFYLGDNQDRSRSPLATFPLRVRDGRACRASPGGAAAHRRGGWFCHRESFPRGRSYDPGYPVCLGCDLRLLFCGGGCATRAGGDPRILAGGPDHLLGPGMAHIPGRAHRPGAGGGERRSSDEDLAGSDFPRRGYAGVITFDRGEISDGGFGHRDARDGGDHR